MTSDAYDAVMRSLDTPLVVVTAAAEGERSGCLVGFHTQSSITPPRHTIWLSKANHTCRTALRATHLGIHFLSADDRPLAILFGTRSSDDIDKFADLRVENAEGEVPMLLDCPNRLVVRRVATLDEGSDHLCFTTELVTAWGGLSFEPLRLSSAVDLDPGHEADEAQE